MWNRITRSAPGTRASARASGVDSNANGSVSSERKKIAPSRRSCSSGRAQGVGVIARNVWCRGHDAAGASVMGFRSARTDTRS